MFFSWKHYFFIFLLDFLSFCLRRAVFHAFRMKNCQNNQNTLVSSNFLYFNAKTSDLALSCRFGRKRRQNMLCAAFRDKFQARAAISTARKHLLPFPVVFFGLGGAGGLSGPPVTVGRSCLTARRKANRRRRPVFFMFLYSSFSPQRTRTALRGRKLYSFRGIK